MRPRLGFGLSRWRFGFCARLLAAFGLALFRRLLLSLDFGLGSRLGFGFENGLGLADLGKPLFLVRDPGRHLIPAPVLAEGLLSGALPYDALLERDVLLGVRAS